MFRVVEEHKQLLIVIFSSMPCKVSLTSDCWEALTGNHYICVTAHYIDSDWILQKRIIGFNFFPFPHNASNLSQVIMKVVRDFGIDSKISNILFDNASENIAAIEIL